MGNRRLTALWAAALALVLIIALLSATAYARYRAELTSDVQFQAKPLEQIKLAGQTWKSQEDGCVLTFSLKENAGVCRVYLAVSEGITAPEALQVTLTVPGEEPVILEGVQTPIAEGSAIDALFGPGTVFRFTGEAEREELQLELTADTQYTVTVRGLESAAEQTSLLRLFIEHV